MCMFTVCGAHLHDADLCGAHVIGEVLVVGGGPGEDEEDGVAEQRHAVLHPHHHLLPHPLLCSRNLTPHPTPY